MIAFLPEKLFQNKGEKLIKSYGLLSIYYALFTGVLLFLGIGLIDVFYLQGLLFIPSVGLVFYILFSNIKKSDFKVYKDTNKIGKVGLSFIFFLIFFGTQNYLGLSTAGNFSMFSNLVTEGEKGNHLLLKNNYFKIFSLQDDLVWVEKVTPQGLDFWRKGWSFTGYGIPLIEFKRSLHNKRKDERYYEVSMEFTYNEKRYFVENIVLDESWSPKEYDWKMKLFQFRRVHSLQMPVYCQW